MTALRVAIVAVTLGLGADSLRSATPVAEPAAIVYGLKGGATLGAPASKRPLQLFAWIPAGETIEVAAGSTVALAFSNGTRYELGPSSSARLGKSELESQVGSVRRLPSVPPLPHIDRIVEDAAVGSRAGALRIRGRSSSTLYPSPGTTSIADATTLRFEPVAGATQYRVEVTDGTGKAIFQKETSSTSLPIPAGLLKPGSRYGWTRRALDRNETVQSAHSQISTLDAAAQSSRAALRKSLGPAGDPTSFALLAGVDRNLGLLWEAREELRQAVAQSPRNKDLRDALTRLDQGLQNDPGK